MKTLSVIINLVWFGSWWMNLHKRSCCSTWVPRKINLGFAKDSRKFFYSRRIAFPGRNFDQPSYSTYKYRYIYIYLLYLFIFFNYLFIEDIWRLLCVRRFQFSISKPACLYIPRKRLASGTTAPLSRPRSIAACGTTRPVTRFLHVDADKRKIFDDILYA